MGGPNQCSGLRRESPLSDGLSPVQSRFFDSPCFNNQDPSEQQLATKDVRNKKRSISQKNLVFAAHDFAPNKDLKKRGLELVEAEAELNLSQPPKLPARSSAFDNYCIREAQKEAKKTLFKVP